MEDDHFFNDNLAIIEQDDDYEIEPTTELMEKMTKNKQGEVYKNLTGIQHSDELITKKYFNEFVYRLRGGGGTFCLTTEIY